MKWLSSYLDHTYSVLRTLWIQGSSYFCQFQQARSNRDEIWILYQKEIVRLGVRRNVTYLFSDLANPLMRYSFCPEVPIPIICPPPPPPPPPYTIMVLLWKAEKIPVFLETTEKLVLEIFPLFFFFWGGGEHDRKRF